MRNLVFATNNAHKLKEVRQILCGLAELTSLADIGCTGDIPETGDTIEENASQKSRYIFERTERDCFADDTALEVDALGGQPGVYSARYAGEGKSFTDNILKLLGELKGIANRKARFRTVVSLILDGREYFFEGVVEGEILENAAGNMGFGYDPVFRPAGHKLSFAEMSDDTKNAISHRGEAIRKMAAFLESY